MTQRSDLHAEYEAAERAQRDAWQRYRDAENAMWEAERLWDISRERTQKAFVALSMEFVANGEVAREGER